MAMVIRHNSAAMGALAQLQANASGLEKTLRKVSSGTRINGAGDDASGYAISERMRVRLRALEQDERNVKNGRDLLRVAEGGVQSQVNIMKTVKERVLNAANDTNTETDRATIQKEIDQAYDQLQDIAYSVAYNGRRLLTGGDYLVERVISWEVLDKAVPVSGSDAMNIIPDREPSLDGVEGPFDVFTEYSTSPSQFDTLLEGKSSVNFSGGTEGTPEIVSTNFDGYANIAAMEGVGIRVQDGSSYRYFLLTADPTKNYNKNYYSVTTVDISGCADVAAAVAALAGRITQTNGTQAAASGTTLTLTSGTKSAQSSVVIAGWNSQYVAAKPEVPGTPGTPAVTGSRPEVPKTGLGSHSLSGGTDATGSPGSSDPDMTYTPAKTASLTLNASGVAADTGFTLHGSSTYRIKFVDGNQPPTRGTNDPANNKYEGDLYIVGKSWNGAYNGFSGVSFQMQNGVLTITANTPGTTGNRYSISDGISANSSVVVTPATPGTGSPAQPEQLAVNRFNGRETVLQSGADGDTAYYDIDATGYADVEALIKEMTGKTLRCGSAYEFIDSSSKDMDHIQRYNGSKLCDLNELRQSAAAGQSIAEAFADFMRRHIGATRCQTLTDANGQTTGARLFASVAGPSGNSQTLSVSEGTPRSYEIDYGAWFQSTSESIPAFLNGKGFRVYCATDASQWFNFLFTDGTGDENRPASGTKDEDIKSILIDVSSVRDAASLVEAIYDQAMPILEGSDPRYNHHIRLAADTENGVLTVYDRRLFRVDVPGYDYQEQGAKIADGVLDNVIKKEREVRANDLIIQHTDKANMNIHLKIPQTSLDHIFEFIPGAQDIREFNVMTKEMRDRLLGVPPNDGLLDTGINYLLGAMTLIGAQMTHLSTAEANIVTAAENERLSESTIRDADMAKEMTEYTKQQVLTQSAQAMLAQANQDGASVLSLLQ